MFVYLNIFFVIYFLFAAVVQYNDPDPYLWMPIYLYAAFLCFYAAKKSYNRIFYFPAIALYSILAVYYLASDDGVLSWWRQHDAENLVQSMKATKPWIEQSREFFGLLITIVILLFNYFWLKKKGVAEGRITGRRSTRRG